MKHKIAVIGMGYVGLPIAIEFGKYFKTIGFDLDLKRIKDLKRKIDKNQEITKTDFQKSNLLSFTNHGNDISECNTYIICVPTPVNKKNKPDLTYLKNATKFVSNYVKENNFVIYESTVSIGTTEDICAKIITNKTKLNLITNFSTENNKGFHLGYSPERINPGIGNKKLKNIKKIVSGSSDYSLRQIKNIYKKIIKAGIYEAPTIRVAEAAKIIENCQRDINIAFVNELSILFDKMKINTNEVLDAASTKWNFLNFKPGLVGGHCIGVDPYYLIKNANDVDYKSQIILAGRKLNNQMPVFVFNKFARICKEKSIKLKNSRILIMGVTFKEDCPDIRNSKALDVIKLLLSKTNKINIYDPIVNKKDLPVMLRKFFISKITFKKYDSVLILVAHKNFKKITISGIKKFCKKTSVIFDVKNIFDQNSKIDGSM